jgi:hypothetical protein
MVAIRSPRTAVAFDAALAQTDSLTRHNAPGRGVVFNLSTQAALFRDVWHRPKVSSDAGVDALTSHQG